jgi:hypothetical protein
MGKDGQAFFIYSVVQLVIACLETALVLGEIICNVFAIGAGFCAVSGPLCIGKSLVPLSTMMSWQLQLT